MVGGDNHAGWPMNYLIIWLKNQSLVIYKIKISRILIIMEIGLGFARQQE
jgi:hypothetical protein